MKELDGISKAFVAGQDTHFREMVKGWAVDETISNAEFSRLVVDLGWNQAMERLQFLSTVSISKQGVDASQPSKVR